MISSKLRDVSVTLVGLSMSCITFTVAQKERNASLLGFSERKWQFKSPVTTMSLLSDKAWMYLGINSFSRHATPISGGL